MLNYFFHRITEVQAAVSTSSSTQPRYALPTQVHHYNFSLDLRSLRDLDTNVPLNVYAR